MLFSVFCIIRLLCMLVCSILVLCMICAAEMANKDTQYDVVFHSALNNKFN